jgi:CheY-like chemotaxis protein
MDHPVATEAAGTLDEASASRRLSVLVIEDDTLTRITLCKIFSKMNYTPIEACNGFMGLKMYKQHKPDVIVTDLLMPDKEGLETIAEIRATDKQVKIVAMSGGGSTQNMSFLNIAKKVGADYTLSKPFKPAEILGLLQNLRLSGA